MSGNVDILRSLVNERLTAAAEEIFALVERTIVEYEEELCRSKEENQRKQQLLDLVLNQHSTQGVQTDTLSLEPSVKQRSPEAPQIKEEPEEQRLKQEEEQPPEFTAVCVKSEEPSSLLQQRQSRKGGADISLDPHGHLYFNDQTDNDEDWEPAASTSTAQMETEADGDHYNQVQIKDTSTDDHNSDLFNIYKCGEGHVSGTGGGRDKKYECAFCTKSFRNKEDLKRHLRIHTGEKPYSCLVCNKTFALKGNLNKHMNTHSGAKTHRCCICNKMFAHSHYLKEHMKSHTGEKPHTCPICMKTFARKSNLNTHMYTHTVEKPYSCGENTEADCIMVEDNFYRVLQRNPVKNQVLHHNS